MNHRRAFVFAGILVSVSACSAGAYSSIDDIPEDPAPAGDPGHFGLGLFVHDSPYASEGAARIMRALCDAMPGSPRSVKLRYAILSPTYVTIRAYRGGIDFDDWMWRDGTIDDPHPSQGTTETDAAAVFDSASVPWTMMPELRHRALGAAQVEGGRVQSLMVSASKGELEILATIHGTRHDASVTFNAKGERIR